jgi:hypothetical protein
MVAHDTIKGTLGNDTPLGCSERHVINADRYQTMPRMHKDNASARSLEGYD